jgi:hypothetical protein
VPKSAHATRNVYSQLSRLEDVVFNDFIKDDKCCTIESRMIVMFLKHWVSTSETLECVVENVSAIVNINTLKGRFITHKFSTGWAVGVVKSVEKKKSVAGQFAVRYRSET